MNKLNIELIVEDDKARSKFIYNFLQKKQCNISEKVKIPKVIMQYWHSLEEIPIDVLECIKSWEILKSKGFSFSFFDDESAKFFIKNNLEKENLESYLKCHHPAMRCDYFRLCYLYVCGGFYVDSDEILLNTEIDFLFDNNNIKIQPLCYSLKKNKMIDTKDFLGCSYDETNIYYFNNNPIISPPGHPLIGIALRRATDNLLNEKNIFDIQSTTGPGNLSAALVYYILHGGNKLEYINDWNSISENVWFLSYRNDNRNWRLYNKNERKWFENN